MLTSSTAAISARLSSSRKVELQHQLQPLWQAQQLLPPAGSASSASLSKAKESGPLVREL